MNEIAQTHPPAAAFRPDATGVTPPSNALRQGAFLTDVIVELGFADREAVERAEMAARQAEQRVEDYMLANGLLDEQQLSLAVAERNGLDQVDLDTFEVDLGAAQMINRSAAERYGAVPIAFAEDGSLVVAVEDPLDSLGVSDIEVMTKSEVRRVISTADGIRRVIEHLPDEAPRQQTETEPDLEPEIHALQVSDATPPIIDSVPPPNGSAPPIETSALPLSVAPPEPSPRSESDPDPEPAPAPDPDPEPQWQPEPEQPQQQADTPADLFEELQELRREASRADEVAAAVGRRIEELQDSEQRAQALERELAEARGRIEELEQRVSGMDAAVVDVREATETLRALRRSLDASAGLGED